MDWPVVVRATIEGPFRLASRLTVGIKRLPTAVRPTGDSVVGRRCTLTTARTVTKRFCWPSSWARRGSFDLPSAIDNQPLGR